MDPEARRMMQENLELSRDNNRLLRKLRRAAVIDRFIQIIWWAFLIGVPIYLYFTILEPRIDQLNLAYQNIQISLGELQKQVPGLENILNVFKKEPSP